jgi:hypothetical protein
MTPDSDASGRRVWQGPFAPLVTVIGGLVALVALSPLATYILKIGPPISFLGDDQIVTISLTGSLALYALLTTRGRVDTARWRVLVLRCSGISTVVCLTAYIWLFSEFVVSMPAVNDTTIIIGHLYTPLAERVRANHPMISDQQLITHWFACEIDECFDEASIRTMNRVLFAAWMAVWFSLSALIWALTAKLPQPVRPAPEQLASVAVVGEQTRPVGV